MRLFQRIALVALFALATVATTIAQTTAVTLNVTDADAQTWNNGTWDATLVPAQGITGPFFVTGTATPVPNQHQSGALNGSGSAAITLNSTNQISPGGTQWLFVVCPNATSPCFNQSSTIQGATQTLNLAPPAIRINLTSAPFRILAYTDTEISNPALGTQYFNTITFLQKFWNGSIWTTFTTGTALPALTQGQVIVGGPGGTYVPTTKAWTEARDMTPPNNVANLNGKDFCNAINQAGQLSPYVDATNPAAGAAGINFLDTANGIPTTYCHQNPFSGTSAKGTTNWKDPGNGVSGELKLGTYVIVTDKEWVPPQKSIDIIGTSTGAGGIGNNLNGTTLQMCVTTGGGSCGNTFLGGALMSDFAADPLNYEVCGHPYCPNPTVTNTFGAGTLTFDRASKTVVSTSGTPFTSAMIGGRISNCATYVYFASANPAPSTGCDGNALIVAVPDATHVTLANNWDGTNGAQNGVVINPNILVLFHDGGVDVTNNGFGGYVANMRFDLAGEQITPVAILTGNYQERHVYQSIVINYNACGVGPAKWESNGCGPNNGSGVTTEPAFQAAMITDRTFVASSNNGGISGSTHFAIRVLQISITNSAGGTHTYGFLGEGWSAFKNNSGGFAEDFKGGTIVGQSGNLIQEAINLDGYNQGGGIVEGVHCEWVAIGLGLGSKNPVQNMVFSSFNGANTINTGLIRFYNSTNTNAGTGTQISANAYNQIVGANVSANANTCIVIDDTWMKNDITGNGIITCLANFEVQQYNQPLGADMMTYFQNGPVVVAAATNPLTQVANNGTFWGLYLSHDVLTKKLCIQVATADNSATTYDFAILDQGQSTGVNAGKGNVRVHTGTIAGSAIGNHLTGTQCVNWVVANSNGVLIRKGMYFFAITTNSAASPLVLSGNATNLVGYNFATGVPEGVTAGGAFNNLQTVPTPTMGTGNTPIFSLL